MSLPPLQTRKPWTRLSEAEKQYILRCHDQGFGPSQIAKVLDRPPGTVFHFIKKTGKQTDSPKTAMETPLNRNAPTASTSGSSNQSGYPASIPPPQARSLSNTASGTRPAKRKLSMDSSIVTTSSEKARLDEEIARMIFATNSPFRLVQHPQFRKMIKKLRPGYTPPTRQEIADKYLPLIYEKEYRECMNDLKNKTVCLSLDGWSNIHNEPIINITLTTEDGQIYLVNTQDTSAQPCTVEYLADLAKISIQKCEEEFGCHVGSVVTDNADNVAKMRQLLEQSRELNLLTYGCSAHILNLLAHDLENDNIKEDVVSVVKYFRNNHYASAKYQQEGGQRLVTPQDNRWSSMSDCLETYINNWPTLRKICEVNREMIDPGIRKKVLNFVQNRSAEDLLVRLEPIAKALDQVQSDKCTIAEAVDIWKELCKHFSNTGSMKAVTMVNKRYKQFITNAHLLANLIHPSFQGNALSEEETNDALAFANEKYPILLPTIMKFQAKSPPFQAFKFSESVTKKVTATEWWESHSSVLSPDILFTVQKLLSAVATSSGVERVFSSFGFDHSKLRNRLGTEKASKLIFLFKSMNAHMTVEDDNKDDDD